MARARAAARRTARAAAPGTTTGHATCDEVAVEGAPPLSMFDGVDAAVRLRIELVVRASASPETALPVVIALLVPNEEARPAIVDAFTSNEYLFAQWQRAWHELHRD